MQQGGSGGGGGGSYSQPPYGSFQGQQQQYYGGGGGGPSSGGFHPYPPSQQQQYPPPSTGGTPYNNYPPSRPPASSGGGGAPPFYPQQQQQFYGGGSGSGGGGGGGYHPPQQQQYYGGGGGGGYYPYMQQQQPSVIPKPSTGTEGWLSYYGQPSSDEMMMLREWFNAVDQDRSGSIDATELQRALAAGGDKFDTHAVRQMVAMFDADGNGNIDLSEFVSLFRYIGAIRHSFDTFDQRRKGSLDVNETAQAIARANFNLPQVTLVTAFQKFDKERKGSLTFAQYLEMAMWLGTIRSHFERLDRQRSGSLHLGLDGFTALLAGIYQPLL
ncbi:Protodermal factor 1 [Balamuthia mandrillaris]